MTITVAVPSRGEVRAETLTSLVALAIAMERGGIGMKLRQFHYYDSAESRNLMTTRFLESEGGSHILFVDADMGFSPATVQRLIDFNEPVVGAIYPRRGLSIQRVIERVRATPGAGDSSVMAAALDHVYFNGSFEGEAVPDERRGDFVRVNGIGMGLALLARTALEQMVQERAVARIVSQTGEGSIWDFFGHAYSDDGTRRYSDDLSFCRRWVLGCGGEVWADAGADVCHVAQVPLSA